MQKFYDHQQFEDAHYARWEQSGKMRADNTSEKPSFTIPLPPPNVTGQLHLGHAAMLAIEDIMIRYKKMTGHEALWIPGTDHAAIATENVVIKHHGKTSREQWSSREAFLGDCKTFAEEKHDTIVNQMKKMGAWLDWSREAYTFDETRNHAVNTMFKMLYEDGLIERGYRMINWSIGAQSVLSDDEVEHKEVNGHFYHYRYFLLDGEGNPTEDFVEIATTRPETLFGDMALAIHPEDPRAKDLVGRLVQIPFTNREIPILADEHADPEFGTGMLKVTPAHDPNDFEIGKRHGLEKVQVIGFDGIMMDNGYVASDFIGMTREECRKAITQVEGPYGVLVKKYLVKHKPHVHNVGFCYRSDTVVEPMISPQWFILVNKEFTDRHTGETTTLKQQMQEAVRRSHVDIIPNRFEKEYFRWIDNLQDWCISRQIWWGHRIPVWYDTDGSIAAVGETDAVDPTWKQDEDTLDTWFSSALWPFSTLGWPDKDSLDLSKFYQNDVLETGWDILFFWVARMIMFGRYALGEYPFKTVYLHGMVCDEHGKKMSKSKGNGIDPLEAIHDVGADAVRLALVIGSSPGAPIPIGENKIKGYRNFVNKMWNAGRFVQMQVEQNLGGSVAAAEIDLDGMYTSDSWILSRLSAVTKQVQDSLEKYEISSAGDAIYHFVWDEFCDWYVETVKGAPNKEQSTQVLYYVFGEILKLVHPLCPFVTETLWQQLYDQDSLVSDQDFPVHTLENTDADRAFGLFQEVVGAIRKVRTDHAINPKDRLNIGFEFRDSIVVDDELALRQNTDVLKVLAQLGEMSFGNVAKDSQHVTKVVLDNLDLYIEIPFDEEKEKERVEKERASLQKAIAGFESRLANKAYTDKAPAHLVEETREQLRLAKEKLANL